MEKSIGTSKWIDFLSRVIFIIFCANPRHNFCQSYLSSNGYGQYDLHPYWYNSRSRELNILHLTIGVLKETETTENRVSQTPESVAQLVQQGLRVIVENDAGIRCSYTNEDYINSGAIICNKEDLFQSSDIIVKIRPPTQNEVQLLHSKMFISCMKPLHLNQQVMTSLLENNVTVFGLDFAPKPMPYKHHKFDALSSQAVVAGYASIIESTQLCTSLPSQTPNIQHEVIPDDMDSVLMNGAKDGTEDGTEDPTLPSKPLPKNKSKALIIGTTTLSFPPNFYPNTMLMVVLGAGVAGLSAVSTAMCVGYSVTVVDHRPYLQSHVELLGATFLWMNEDTWSWTKKVKGHPNRLDRLKTRLLTWKMRLFGDSQRRQTEIDQSIHKNSDQSLLEIHAMESDIIICTVVTNPFHFPHNKTSKNWLSIWNTFWESRPPLIIPRKILKKMKPGSVLMDMASSPRGGNVQDSKQDSVVKLLNDVKIIGYSNLPSRFPSVASTLFAKVVVDLIGELIATTSMMNGHEYYDVMLMKEGVSYLQGEEIVQNRTRGPSILEQEDEILQMIYKKLDEMDVKTISQVDEIHSERNFSFRFDPVDQEDSTWISTSPLHNSVQKSVTDPMDHVREKYKPIHLDLYHGDQNSRHGSSHGSCHGSSQLDLIESKSKHWNVNRPIQSMSLQDTTTLSSSLTLPPMRPKRKDIPIIIHSGKNVLNILKEVKPIANHLEHTFATSSVRSLEETMYIQTNSMNSAFIDAELIQPQKSILSSLWGQAKQVWILLKGFLTKWYEKRSHLPPKTSHERRMNDVNEPLLLSETVTRVGSNKQYHKETHLLKEMHRKLQSTPYRLDSKTNSHQIPVGTTELSTELSTELQPPLPPPTDEKSFGKKEKISDRKVATMPSLPNRINRNLPQPLVRLRDSSPTEETVDDSHNHEIKLSWNPSPPSPPPSSNMNTTSGVTNHLTVGPHRRYIDQMKSILQSSPKQSSGRTLGRWIELYGSYLLPPIPTHQTSHRVIHFLGDSIVGAAPQIMYRYLLEALNQAGYWIIATPYRVDLDLNHTFNIITARLECVLHELQSTYWSSPSPSASNPTVSLVCMGHGVGALLQSQLTTTADWNLTTSSFPIQSIRNVLISYRNRPLREMVPGLSTLLIPFTFTSSTLRRVPTPPRRPNPAWSNPIDPSTEWLLSSIQSSNHTIFTKQPTHPRFNSMINGFLTARKYFSKLLKIYSESILASTYLSEEVIPLIEQSLEMVLDQFPPLVDQWIKVDQKEIDRRWKRGYTEGLETVTAPIAGEEGEGWKMKNKWLLIQFEDDRQDESLQLKNRFMKSAKRKEQQQQPFQIERKVLKGNRWTPLYYNYPQKTMELSSSLDDLISQIKNYLDESFVSVQ